MVSLCIVLKYVFRKDMVVYNLEGQVVLKDMVVYNPEGQLVLKDMVVYGPSEGHMQF